MASLLVGSHICLRNICIKRRFHLDGAFKPLVGSGASMLRSVLLALLADGKPAHGYALMKAYQERSGFRLSIGNVYRELQRLLADGLIVTAENPVGADPRRAPYTINDAGRETLAAFVSEPARELAQSYPDPLSYHLAILGDVDPSQAEAFLNDLHDELWIEAKFIERERSSTSLKEKEGSRVLQMRTMLLGRQARRLAGDIELVEEMRTRLATWRTGSGAVAESSRVTAQPEQRTSRRQKQRRR